MNWIPGCLVLFTICCAACVSPAEVTHTWGKDGGENTIFLVSHGWHAGIVFSRAEIRGEAWQVPGNFSHDQYLEVGWGDRDFYQAPGPHPGIILNAALLPTASVLHIVGFDEPVPDFFPSSEVIAIELSSTGFERLSRTIAANFARDKAGKVSSLGPGLYGNSRFYPSVENYHLFNTCNVWTARGLRSAGLPVAPARALTVESLMAQVRKFGTVIQAPP